MQLSHNEYLIMELLWKEQRPLSRAEILKGTVGRNWNPSSIHLILNSMQSKGVIKITDEEKKYGRTYEAVITQEEYMLNCVDNGIHGKAEGEKLLGIVSALVDRAGVNEKVISTLESLLDRKRQELLDREEEEQKR